MAYFDDLAENGEVTPARFRVVPSLMWDDLENQKPRPDNFAHTSTGRPGPFKQISLTSRGHTDELISEGKLDCPLEERSTFYDGLRGQVLHLSLSLITLYILQERKLRKLKLMRAN